MTLGTLPVRKSWNCLGDPRRNHGSQPLVVLLGDPAVSDILVNGPDTIYVERGDVYPKWRPLVTTHT